jgi:Asp-tRNA(Asn)/Glu-tRNA(Gln) amidotransferase A subunit family amidase
MGSPAFAGFVPEKSAAMVVRAEAQGAFTFGKTVTAGLAHFTPGPTRNPWNRHTPGGSSMGSAARGRGRHVALAFGTQTNGSVIARRRLRLCRFQAGRGTLATAGIQPFSDARSAGLFARSVEDVALAFAALREGPEASRTRTGRCRRSTRAPRLAAVRSPVWSQAESSRNSRSLRRSHACARQARKLPRSSCPRNSGTRMGCTHHHGL